MPAAKLSALADVAARRWMRADRLGSKPPFHTLPAEFQSPQMAETYREAARLRRRRAERIRDAVRDREFIPALDAMGWFDLRHVRFLEQVFPLMTFDERATALPYVWCRLRVMPSTARSLRLFRAASSLRETVPVDWPAIVQVYRGSFVSHQWPEPWLLAKRIARRGIAWTTDRATAMTFTARMPGHIGCLATATVSRASIMAWLHDPEECEEDGQIYPVDGYHEHECIIDPRAIKRVTYEQVQAPKDI